MRGLEVGAGWAARRTERAGGGTCGGARPGSALGFVLQLPSFARRSNILTGLQDPTVDTRPKLDLGSSGKSQQHQYELNSKKHHQIGRAHV